MKRTITTYILFALAVIAGIGLVFFSPGEDNIPKTISQNELRVINISGIALILIAWVNLIFERTRDFEKKVRVFASYQFGKGLGAKMVGDEKLNRFDVIFSSSSKMIDEIERILRTRHTDEVKKGIPIIINHFQIIGSF